MNILVTLNDAYVVPLLIMLSSLFKHHDGIPITVYVFWSSLTQENRERISACVSEYDGQVSFVCVHPELFADAPVLRYFTKEMYYRILCGHLIPATEDRVLYLDPDILIRGSIVELYHTDFSGSYIIGVEDYAINHNMPEKKKAIGLSEENIYINSGVLLFNLKQMRKRFVLSDFLGLLEQYHDFLSYPDQDMINLYFKGDIKVADRKYNYDTAYTSVKHMVYHMLGFDRSERSYPVILHYMGDIKPWHAGYYESYFFMYYSYLVPYLSLKERMRLWCKPFHLLARAMKVVFVYWPSYVFDKWKNRN